MKCATTYKRKGKIFFHSSSKTTAGVWIATGPFLSIEDSEQSSKKGNYIKEVLKSSEEGITHPNSWENLFEPILNLAGVKSWSTFAKSAISCSIELENDELQFIPNRNLGPREGYEPIHERTLIVSFDTSIEKIGYMLDRAFEACE
jgi:hypothetical protein